MVSSSPSTELTNAVLNVFACAEERHASISQAVVEIAENRASIEQAKGVLMYVYGIGPDAAFDMLRWRSQEGNVKLRALAEQLMTVHERITRGRTTFASSIGESGTRPCRTDC
jgi:ANTAR domain